MFRSDEPEEEPQSESEPEAIPFSFSNRAILGWRAWEVVEYEEHGGIKVPRLAAVGMQGVWPPRRRAEALCGSHVYHDAPSADCSCGLWAVQSRRQAERTALEYRGREDVMAFGLVALWGRVLKCRLGWRAQYAYPQKLFVMGAETEQSRQLERIYGIDVSNVHVERPVARQEVTFTFGVKTAALARAMKGLTAAFSGRVAVIGQLRALGLASPGQFWDEISAPREDPSVLIAPIVGMRGKPVDPDDGLLWDPDVKTWLSPAIRQVFPWRKAMNLDG